MNSNSLKPYRHKHSSFKKGGQRRFKQCTLDVNMKGFLCSCNSREKDCLREALNLLNRHADKLPDNDAVVVQPAQDEQQEDVDIEEQLSEEVSNLKSKETTARFQAVESGAKNVLFIKTTVDNPLSLAEIIITDICETKKQQTRFLIRLVPIQITCKAYVKDIEKAFEPLIERHFLQEPQVFSIIYNHRNNDSLSKNEVIKMLADKITASRPGHVVKLTEAKVSVIVEVIRGIALLSVIPNYLKYKKFNLHSICDDNENKQTQNLDVPVGVETKQ